MANDNFWANVPANVKVKPVLLAEHELGTVVLALREYVASKKEYIAQLPYDKVEDHAFAQSEVAIATTLLERLK